MSEINVSAMVTEKGRVMIELEFIRPANMTDRSFNVFMELRDAEWLSEAITKALIEIKNSENN